MQPLTLILLTFVGVLAIVVGAFWLFVVRREATEHAALAKRLKPADPAKKSRLAMSKAELRPEGGPRLLRGIQAIVDQSGMKLNLPGLLFACWMSGFVVGLAVWTVRPGLLIPLIAGLPAAAIPFLFVRFKANQRMWKFEEQFPEAVDLIARALRAGHAFPIGLMMVAEEVAAPVGPEFKLLYDRQNFGMPFPDALRAFAQRIPVLDAKFFVTAVLTQREAGGNLAGVLDNLSSVIRERFKVKRQVRVISAHGRMTASVLMGLPPFVAVAQTVVAPANAKLLFQDPIGQKILIVAGVMQVIGMLVIRKLIKVEY